MATVIALSELEALTDGARNWSQLSPLEPRSVELDFGASSLGRALTALRAVDAIAASFPRSRLLARGSPTVKRLLEAHLREGRASVIGAGPADLRVDLRPSARGTSAWLGGALPTLRVGACPFPERAQHAGRHFVDGARSAGLDVVDATPRLRLPSKAITDARALVRTRCGFRPLVLMHRGPRGWNGFQPLRERLERRIGARVFQLGARIAGVEDLGAREPTLVAAVLHLACAVVSDAGGITHLAAATGAPVVSLHGRHCPIRHGPACPLGLALFSECKVPLLHRPSPRRGSRCLECLPLDAVGDASEEMAARRWPWDHLARLGLARGAR